MKKIFMLVAVVVMVSSCKVLEEVVLKPSNFETVSALREVLNSSAFRAIASFKKVNDGGLEALLPEELDPVFSTLRTMGLGEQIDEIEDQLVNVSGVVVAESGYIMEDAIKELSFNDAVAVVVGGEDAATQVLREAMYGAVKKRYSVRLEEELNKSGSDALQYWPVASRTYNMFADNKIEGSLPDFLAERSVDVLFIAMGQEEKKIRTDYRSLGKSVVTKVFDYYTTS